VTDVPTSVARLVSFFERLTPQTLHELDALYAADARFKDPFNDVTGLPAIRGIFAHMFVALKSPGFVVTSRIEQGSSCFLIWEFHFEFKRFRRNQPQVILGSSHIIFDDAGRVTLHRDYWDAAEELYEKLPLVGGLMRWLKRRANN